jgi:mannose-1-phosphate guanylyltransferase
MESREGTGSGPRASAETLEHLQPWVIVLAAGEGTRLASLTRLERGPSVPKQFCSVDGQRSLLGTALERAERLTSAERIVPVVAATHRRWWATEVEHLDPAHVVVQPAGRGTAAGLLLPLLHVRAWDREATVIVLPSDHVVEDELILQSALESALHASLPARATPVLLGMAPDRPDTGYGWIVPATSLDEWISGIAAFVEKPPAARAAELLEGGGVWSTFMLAGRIDAIVQLYRAALPGLLATFVDLFETAAGLPGEAALVRLYERLPVHDFSREVLEQCVDHLRVLRTPCCGWTDVGTPERLARCSEAIDLPGRFRARMEPAGRSAYAGNV